jgi:hypothetical protein
VLLLLTLTSCAPGPSVQESVASQGGEVAGFWLGLWHGITAPITFLISLFSDNGIYEIHKQRQLVQLRLRSRAGVLLGGSGAGSRGRKG